jgi:hypothetical protein
VEPLALGVENSPSRSGHDSNQRDDGALVRGDRIEIAHLVLVQKKEATQSGDMGVLFFAT